MEPRENSLTEPVLLKSFRVDVAVASGVGGLGHCDAVSTAIGDGERSAEIIKGCQLLFNSPNPYL